MSGSRLQRGPRLLRAAKAGEVKIAALFGGQGLHNSQCLDELVHLHRTQNEHTSNLFQRAAYLLEQLATTTRASGFHDDWGFDLTHWLADPSSAPPKDYLALAPISFPLNTLLGLAHYCIACRRAASTPGQFRSALTSTVGYSQGVFVAAAIAISTSWNSFWEATEFVLRLSFGVGLESHLASPPSSISPAARKECIEQGHGQPSPMLSVVGLAGADVASIIQQSNDSLGKQSNDAVYHALEVSRDRHILAGSISSLWKLCLYLRRIRAPDGLDQDRVPFHERKPVIDLRFLPISAPFHSPHLAAIESIIMQSPNYLLPSMPPAGSRLLIHPVKLQTKMESPTESTHDLARALVRAVTVDRVEWQHVSQGLSQDIAYLLDFGPGRIGDLVLRNTLGSALSVVNMADGNGKNRSDTGAQIDFYSSEMPSPATQWRTKFGPRVTRAPDKGAFQVETKMTKVFGTPPIMVPGMVPTTTHPDVVATIMQAGYHAELGGGGFSNEASFERAVRSLAAQVPPHRGVTCNIIYANPQTIAWQISCLRRLIREGIAISGITIGAGIPSDEAVAEYIEYMDLKHISFKPGSVSAIRRVVEIAQKYPHFPVGLQWTGGRAGGHHSSEDFHTAILKEYGHIRECDNIILIAGSGFGGGEDSLPYLSGEWSVAYGYSHMPFDGILIGSRMMVCKEAHTSPAAKRLIVETKGVSDAEWHHTYRNPVGGVVTIQSEMGQPIHMLATRGVMLWKDLDEKVFSLKDPATRLQYLRTHHEDIVARLIKDYAKPWFAVDAKGRIVRLEDMTYIEVLRRLYCLLYVRHQCRWIDPSYERLVQDYLKLVAERANCAALSCDRTSGDTFDAVIHSFANSLGRTADAVLHPQDVAILFALFRRRGQKPVPFVPALDEHFETWFKKDCLWQAEDLDAVVDQDVQRVSIIHGPVAAQYSTTDDESAVEILDKIHKHYATSFCESSEPASTSSALQQSIIDQSSLPQLRDFKVSTQNNVRRYEIPKNLRALSTASLWQHIAGTLPWLRAALIEDRMFGPAGWVTNPIRAAFTPQLGDIVAVGMTPHVDWEVQSVTLLSYRGQGTSGQRTPVIRISLQEQGTVLVTLSPRTAHTRPPVVQLTYTLDQDAAGSRLYVRNSTALSNHRAMQDFYRLIWAQNDSSLQNSSGLGSEFRSEPLTLTADRVQKYEDVIHRLSPCQIPTWKPTMPLSLDFCVVVAWEVLTKPLMVPVLECDFMRLLHQSVNIFQDPSMEPLRVGHTVCTVARITGLSTMPHGKRIEVTADVLRDEIAVVTIKTEFFVRGGGTGTKLPSYQSSQEPDMLFSVDTDVRKAILLSRNWLHLEDRSSKVDLYGLNLSFQLTSHKTYDMEGQITSLQVVGNVYALGASTIDPVQVGSVYFEREGDNVANVVMEFLSRHGTTRFARQTLSNPGWIEGEDSTISIAAPAQSGSYAAVSTDHNPIHVCPVFAQYAGLDGVVVHGMNTSAIVYRLLQTALGDLERSRFQHWKVVFQDVVRPRDLLRIEFQHVAMERGAMVIQVQAFNDKTGDRVLEAEASVAQPLTAYVFGGQGSQAKGMGMELYATSPDAKAIWDRGDVMLREKFGFSILKIVRENPQHLLVSFGGQRGRQVRSNYLAMTKKADSTSVHGEESCIVRDIHPASSSHTFSESRGLLFSTQFSQPALALMEIAEYKHFEATGMVQQPGAFFAGHSLGEYAALGACTSFLDLEDLLQLVFYRGLKMQNALTRDMNGRTDFAMVAVDPSRVGKGFNEQALHVVVRIIHEETGLLLEVVNYNVESQQYVCAGHFRTLWTLTQILDELARTSQYIYSRSSEADSRLRLIVQAQSTAAQSLTNEHVLDRGKATIPLSGIDIPFHSTVLREEIEQYRQYLSTRISIGDVKPSELVQRWIPNVMGTPFSLERSYVEQVFDKTGSGPLRVLLEAMA